MVPSFYPRGQYLKHYIRHRRPAFHATCENLMYSLTPNLQLLLPYVSLIFLAEGNCMKLHVVDTGKQRLSESHYHITAQIKRILKSSWDAPPTQRKSIQTRFCRAMSNLIEHVQGGCPTLSPGNLFQDLTNPVAD